MTSSYTTRNRFNKQGTGDGTNVWGDVLNAGVFDLTDFAMDGVTALAITGNVTLTTANGSADQARARTLKLSGTVAAIITLPAVEKWYLIWNGSSQDQTIASQGGGTSVTVKAGEVVFVATDATNVARLTLMSTPGAFSVGGALTVAGALDMGSHKITSVTDPTNAQDAATKTYVDTLVSNTAFAMAAGNLPGQTGNANKFLLTNGAVASWASVTTSLISDYAADQATKQAATQAAAVAQAGAQAIAFAVAL